MRTSRHTILRISPNYHDRSDNFVYRYVVMPVALAERDDGILSHAKLVEICQDDFWIDVENGITEQEMIEHKMRTWKGHDFTNWNIEFTEGSFYWKPRE